MPIPVQDIINQVRQALDAEEAPTSPQLGYYNDLTDIIPNINKAVSWLVGISTSLLEEKKFSSELVRELTYTRIFQTNSFSRFNFDPATLGHELWTLLNIYPLPSVLPVTAIVTPTVDPASLYRADLSLLSSDYTAARLTIGEWMKNKSNMFMPGNTIHTVANAPKLVSYAYLVFSNYTSTGYVLTVPQEIEVRPAIPKSFCGAVYVAAPTPVTLNTQSVQFPSTAFNIIVEKTLSYLAQKIGDGTTIASTSDKELVELLKMIM